MVEAPEAPTFKVLLLEKVADGPGPFVKGDVFKWTYKTRTPDAALGKASELLKRQGEDRINWKLIS